MLFGGTFLRSQQPPIKLFARIVSLFVVPCSCNCSLPIVRPHETKKTNRHLVPCDTLFFFPPPPFARRTSPLIFLLSLFPPSTSRNNEFAHSPSSLHCPTSIPTRTIMPAFRTRDTHPRCEFTPAIEKSIQSN